MGRIRKLLARWILADVPSLLNQHDRSIGALESEQVRIWANIAALEGGRVTDAYIVGVLRAELQTLAGNIARMSAPRRIAPKAKPRKRARK